MHVIKVRNVQQALPEACRLMELKGIERHSRNGPCKQLPEPLATVYTQPQERVLFYPERDANPFFHFFECLWMADGRNDVEWIARYNSTIHQFSDDGRMFNGAYGHRWRYMFGFDQLKSIAQNLKKHPEDRRQVLVMWDPSDLLKVDSKDVPCNTQAYFQINPESGALDLMVTNRSNDLIWGAYGANAVHFSFLLELMSAWASLPVGVYTQVSMNTHVYERHYGLMKQLAQHAPQLPNGRLGDHDPYTQGDASTYPIHSVADRVEWLTDLATFMDRKPSLYSDPFFKEVAVPLDAAWSTFKLMKGEPDRIQVSVEQALRCKATDWRKAAVEWLKRRQQPETPTRS